MTLTSFFESGEEEYPDVALPSTKIFVHVKAMKSLNPKDQRHMPAADKSPDPVTSRP